MCTFPECSNPPESRKIDLCHSHRCQQRSGKLLTSFRKRDLSGSKSKNIRASEATARWRERNLEKVRSDQLANHYRRNHLTKSQYEILVMQQNGCCAICGTDEPGRGNQGWSVDHDHLCCSGRWSCGKCVRGLLCHQCNIGLGSFHDSTIVMNSAIKYLKRSVII